MQFSNIQIARGVAVNLVVFYHIRVIGAKYNGPTHAMPDWTEWGAVGVDLFFVVSGFIMATIAARESYSSFIVSRLTRIFPTYWLYLIAILALSLVVPAIINTSLHNGSSLWLSFLLLPTAGDPLLPVSWTLTLELYFYAVFALLLAIGGPRFANLLLWALLLVVARFMLPDGPVHEIAPVLHVILHPLTLEFIGGACVGLLVQRGLGGRWQVLALIAGLLLFAVSVLSIPNPGPMLQDASWTRVLAIGPACVLVVFGITAGDRLTRIRIPLLNIVGDASYSIYLGHTLIISAVCRVFNALNVHTAAAEWAFVLTCFILANALGVASFHIVERPTLRWARGLIAWMRRTDPSYIPVSRLRP